jgi:hypothetical protein
VVAVSLRNTFDDAVETQAAEVIGHLTLRETVRVVARGKDANCWRRWRLEKPVGRSWNSKRVRQRACTLGSAKRNAEARCDVTCTGRLIF